MFLRLASPSAKPVSLRPRVIDDSEIRFFDVLADSSGETFGECKVPSWETSGLAGLSAIEPW